MSKFKLDPWEESEAINYLNIDIEPPTQIISLKKLGEINILAGKNRKRLHSEKSFIFQKCHHGCKYLCEHLKGGRKTEMERQSSIKRTQLQQSITQLKFHTETSEYDNSSKIEKMAVRHRVKSAKTKMAGQTLFPFGTTFCRSEKNIGTQSSYSSKKHLNKHTKTEQSSPSNSRVLKRFSSKQKIINFDNTKNSFNKSSNKAANRELSIERKIYLMKTAGIDSFVRNKKQKSSKLNNLQKIEAKEMQAATNLNALIENIYKKT